MRKPLIGILANLHQHESGPQPFVELNGLQRDYISAIEQAGGVPIMLPVVEKASTIRQQIACVNGLVLSGGYDVNPAHYGEEPTPLLEKIHPERDAYELQAIKFAGELNKPVLGICRGMQILNVAYGGTLYQDVSYAGRERANHKQKALRHEPTHPVDVVRGTLLHRIINASELSTNSFHHQAVKELAPGFVVNARSRDGLIEGIEMPGARFLLALQWHPEMMAATDPYMHMLFRSFLEAVQKENDDL